MVAAVLLAAPWPGRVPELFGCGRAREHFLDIRAVNEFSRKFAQYGIPLKICAYFKDPEI